MKRNRKGGAPRKAPNGLTKVLYVRADEQLCVKLERLRASQQKQHPHLTISLSDVVRAVLWEALGGR